jgi:hypothetical protein
MVRDRLLVSWAYLVEILLVSALYSLTLLLFTPRKLTEFVLGTANNWASTVDVLLGASIALLIMMVANILFTTFGDELRKRAAVSVYLWGFGTPVLIFFSTTVALKLATWSQDWRVAHFAFLTLLYSAVNTITLIKNTIELAQLYSVYRKRPGA